MKIKSSSSEITDHKAKLDSDMLHQGHNFSGPTVCSTTNTFSRFQESYRDKTKNFKEEKECLIHIEESENLEHLKDDSIVGNKQMLYDVVKPSIALLKPMDKKLINSFCNLTVNVERDEAKNGISQIEIVNRCETDSCSFSDPFNSSATIHKTSNRSPVTKFTPSNEQTFKFPPDLSFFKPCYLVIRKLNIDRYMENPTVINSSLDEKASNHNVMDKTDSYISEGKTVGQCKEKVFPPDSTVVEEIQNTCDDLKYGSSSDVLLNCPKIEKLKEYFAENNQYDLSDQSENLTGLENNRYEMESFVPKSLKLKRINPLRAGNKFNVKKSNKISDHSLKMKLVKRVRFGLDYMCDCRTYIWNKDEHYIHLCGAKRMKGFICPFCEKIRKTMIEHKRHLYFHYQYCKFSYKKY